MLHCGLLGEKLGHSYSPAIHNMLGEYEYRLYEQAPDAVEAFLREGEWNGLNVTIPYKKTVFPYMDTVGEAAKEIGSINTIVKDADGKLHGDNTDVYGFEKMLLRSGIPVRDRKVLVLGSGGASVAVLYVLRKLGALPVVISRKGPDNYENLAKHADAAAIVNTTPVGMYPKNGESPIDLRLFPECKGVLDLIYNPSRTAFLLQAEELGLPYENGLYMLVAQAKRASELFTGKAIADEEIDRIYRSLSLRLSNIVLVGMPGCGKSTVAAKLSELTGRPVLDSDTEFTTRYGVTPEEVIMTKGEPEFRKMETEILRSVGAQSGAIIATGGGVVTRPENYPLLHQNGVIVWLKRDISVLDTSHRPLSQQNKLADLYAVRKPMYEAFADISADVDDDTAQTILEKLTK